jgi:uncharacterized spore protein YtfJ
MENNVSTMLDQISEKLKEMVKTETIIGEEFTMGEYLCKPIIRVGVGFGSGGGTGEDIKSKGCGTGAAAGAGMGISPVGFLVTRKDEIYFISTEKKTGLSALCEKMPEMMEKAMEFKKTKESADQTKKEKHDK